MDTLATRLKAELDARKRHSDPAKKKTATEIAKLAGCSTTTLSDIARGRNSGTKYIAHIAKVLDNMNPLWLIDGKYPKYLDQETSHSTGRYTVSEPTHIKNTLPIFTSTEAKMLREVIHSNNYGNRPTIGIEDYEGRRMYALKIIDDSMEDPTSENTIPPGSHVLVDLDKAPQIGLFVVFIGADGNAYLRQYINDAGQHKLRPLNKQYATLPAPVDPAAYLGVALDIYTRKRLA